MRLGKSLHDWQTKSCPFFCGDNVVAALAETLKYVTLVLFGNAYPAVVHTEAQLMRWSDVRENVHRAAGLGELNRVRQKI